MNQEEQPKKSRVIFDPTINLGNALVLASILAGGAIAWGQMNTKIDAAMLLSQSNTALILELKVSNARLSALAEMTDRRLNRLEERMDLNASDGQPKKGK